MGKFIGIIAAFALLMTACGGNQNTSNSTLNGEVKISGAYALYPLATEWAEDFQKLHPNVKIDVQAGGAGKGITDAMSRKVDFGMVSRSLFKSEIDKGAIGFPVAKDAVVATVNAKNPAIKDILAHGISVEAASQKDVNGIGINNIGYAYDIKTRQPSEGILVVPIDINSDGTIAADEDFYSTKNDVTNAIAQDKFPSPPARDLLLVSNGLPTNEAAIEFLKYVLSKDGQQKNIDNGYITMPEEKIKKTLDLLK